MTAGPRILVLLAAVMAAVMAAGCYTEIGNPGKENKVTATFSIDYSVPAVPKRASSLPLPAAPVAIAIEQFYFNVVEANYRTVEDTEGRIWKVPDSLGRSVDFTGKDTAAVLPPVAVPAGEWTIMKLESRIPLHDTLLPDTLDFERFSNRGYIKGTYALDGRKLRFLCQLPSVPKVNLVYNQELLEQWRHGDAYDLEIIFFAHRWVAPVDLFTAKTVMDQSGHAVAVLDLENNRALYDSLSASFFKSFNSWKVWKE